MPTKKLTPEEKQTRAAQRKLDREAKKLEIVEPIEVADKPEEEKKNLFERVTGAIETKVVGRPKKGRHSKKVDPTIITKVAPLVVSTFAVSFIRQCIAEPYKICAPTQEEVVNMVKPYFNILSRYVEISGHLSENTIDIISAILASVIYGTRAYVTFVNIQEYQSARSTNDGTTRSNGASSTRSDGTGHNGNGYIHPETTRSLENLVVQEPDVTNGSTGDSNDDSRISRYESEIMGNLFKRDLEGRRRLGLL